MRPALVFLGALTSMIALQGCFDEKVVRFLEGDGEGGAEGALMPPNSGDSASSGSQSGAGSGAESGGAPTSLGGSGGTSASGGTSGSGGSAGDSLLVIDDFADCDGRIREVAGRSGDWYHFASPAVELVNVTYSVGMAPTPSWGTQACGVYLTGGCPNCEAAGLGFGLSPNPWDLAPYEGLRVSFESETSLWAVVVTTDGMGSGYSEYIQLAPTGGSSAVREMRFADMLPGTGFLGFELAREIQFTVGDGDRSSFGVGIHRVELF